MKTFSEKTISDYAREEKPILEKEMNDPTDTRTDIEKISASINRMKDSAMAEYKAEYDRMAAIFIAEGIDPESVARGDFPVRRLT